MHAETLRRRVEPEPAPEAPPEAAEARRVGPRPIVAVLVQNCVLVYDQVSSILKTACSSSL